MNWPYTLNKWDLESLETYKMYQDFEDLINNLPVKLQKKYSKSIIWAMDSIQMNFEDEIVHAQGIIQDSQITLSKA